MLVAVWIAGCTVSQNAPIVTASGPTMPPTRTGQDTCAVSRPDFGGPASGAERELFAYDTTASLNLTKAVESRGNGVEVSVVSFSSPDGGTVPGLLFDPTSRAGLRPGVIILPGAGGSAHHMKGEAMRLARHGAVAIAITPPSARRSGPWRRFTVQDRTEQIQLMKDLQRTVDFLRMQPNVDPQRIAFLGISYGGTMGVQFVGLERRLKAAVLQVADGGLVTHETGPGDTNLASLSCGARNSWLRAMVPIEPIRFIPHASPTPLLLQNGRLDHFVPAADAELLHLVAPEPKTIRWYDAGHGLPPQAVADMHAWLHAHIGLDLLKPPS
jgi:dienelactone hydrolase